MPTKPFVKKKSTDYIIDKVSRNVIHIPVTKTTDHRGEETLTDGTPQSISGYFQRISNDWFFDKGGRVQGGDGIIVIKYETATFAENHKVAGDGTDFTVTAIDGTATTISVTTSTAHGLSVGDKIFITATTNYNAQYTVATVPTSKTLTITDSDHNLAAETSGTLTSSYIILRMDSVTSYRADTNMDTPMYVYGNLFVTGDE